MHRILPLSLLLACVCTAASAQTTTPSTSPALTLQPGDLLRIEIWREEDLSGEFLVDERGIVTIPLLGDKRVIDIPVADLRDRFLEEYRVQLRNPSIVITPLRRVFVLGEVNKPGLYSVDPTISLAGVVAMAEGANPSGDLGKIRILRGGETLDGRLQPEASLVSADVRSGDQIFVSRRGWIERNSTFLVSAMLSVPGIIATILALR